MENTVAPAYTHEHLLSFFQKGVTLYLLKGYSIQNKKQDSKERYKEAKTPAYSQQQNNGNKRQIIQPLEIPYYMSQSFWVGLEIPAGYILVDIDDVQTGSVVAKSLLSRKLKHIGLKTPNGFQFIMKDTGKVDKQTAGSLTLSGIIVDYRLVGKGYTVLPTPNIENRIVYHMDAELDAMPDVFLPVRSMKKNEEEVINLPIVEGQRNDVLFRHACRMTAWKLKYSLPIDVYNVLEWINYLFCEPAVDNNELNNIFNSASKQDISQNLPVVHGSSCNVPVVAPNASGGDIKELFNLEYEPQLPENFHLNLEDRLIYIIKKRKDGQEFVPLCPVFVVKGLIDTPSGTKQILCNMHKEIMVDIAMSDVKNFDTDVCSRLLGKTQTRSQIQSMVEYVSAYQAENRSLLPRFTGIERTGWRGDTFYLPSREQSETMWLDNKLQSALTTSGGVAEHVKVFQYLLATPACIVILNALAAPLLRILGIPNYVMHVSGQPHSGKSCAISFAMGLYGNPSELYNQWNATNVGLEVLASSYQDLPVWVEEFESSRKSITLFVEFVYQYVSGKGKARSKKDLMMQKQKNYRGVLLCSAEKDLDTVVMSASENSTAKLGTYRRVIEISGDRIIMPLGNTQIFEPTIMEQIINKLYENSNSHYGHVGKQWVEYIESNIDYIKGLYQEQKQKINTGGGLSNTFALLVTILHTDFVKRMLSPEQLEIVEQHVIDVAKKHGAKNMEVKDIASEFIDSMTNYLLANKGKVVGLAEGYNGEQPKFHNGVIAEVITDITDKGRTDVFITTETFKDICIKFGFSNNILLAELSKKYTLKTRKGKWTVQKYLGGMKTYGYYIVAVQTLSDNEAIG